MAVRTAAQVFVYYRVAVDTAAVRATIGNLMADVAARTGVSGRLLARCDDPATWMEVYAPVTDTAAFARQLAVLVRKHRARAVARDGKRHAESFAALPPLARRAKA